MGTALIGRGSRPRSATCSRGILVWTQLPVIRDMIRNNSFSWRESVKPLGQVFGPDRSTW